MSVVEEKGELEHRHPPARAGYSGCAALLGLWVLFLLVSTATAAWYRFIFLPLLTGGG